jgi:hypothetical protein
MHLNGRRPSEFPRLSALLHGKSLELHACGVCLTPMSSPDLESRAVASIVAWDQDDFAILIDYGHGEWRKYLVGTRDEALKELQRIGFDKRQDCWIGQ